MLKVRNLHCEYGAIRALKGIDLDVPEHSIVCLLGSNGAGKSTLVNSIAGLVPSKEGQVDFQGHDITNKDPHKIVNLGISLAPEGREVFPALTVEENLRMGAFIVRDKLKIKEGYERCYELFPRLLERKGQQAGTLSGGEQQMLAIGRALMSNPKLLLLDEPSLGLAPTIVLQIFGLVQRIRELGTTILLIEQNANMALQVSDHAYVLENGKVSMEGPAETVSKDERIRKIYLGI